MTETHPEPTTPPSGPAGSMPARTLVALILGIVAVLLTLIGPIGLSPLWLVLGVVAVVLGVIAGREKTGRVAARTGSILGAIAVLLNIFINLI